MGEQTPAEIRREWLKCTYSAAYFIDTYCWIYDATESKWIPFRLWPEQVQVIQDLTENRLNVILKARQLGLTWLVLCFMLWKMIFHPQFTGLIFSRREIESIYLLSTERLRGIYNHLPEWAQTKEILTDASHAWQLSNGSVAYAFPTTAGDSYTASFVFVDEADLVPDLAALMNAVKPTIDGGGSMVLLSRVDKETPGSTFKKTYLAARAGKTPWKSAFLPWWVRPGRDQTWYNEQREDILYRTTSLDDLYQQYPATDEEALRPPSMDRRLPFKWLKQCYQQLEPIPTEDIEIGVPFLKVYKLPNRLEDYYIGADPAEGNPTSDDSVAHVFAVSNGEECAVLAGKIEPGSFAEYLHLLSEWYNHAGILPERNNHGHAVILALEDNHDVDPIKGPDGKPGWTTSGKSKAIAFSNAAEMFRDREVILHDEDTLNQLASIGGSTLSAPEGSHDDYATSVTLALLALKYGNVSVEVAVSPVDGYRG